MSQPHPIDHAQRIHRKLTVLLRAGLILMESAADTNRIVRNMQRIAAFLGLEEKYLHIDVLYGTLKVNYSDQTHSFSRFVHSDKYTINMNALAAISNLSWRAIQEDYSSERFEKEVLRIAQMPAEYPLWLLTLCVAMGCGAFCVLFGGDWVSFFPATLAGFVGYGARTVLLRERFNSYMVVAVSAFLATLTAWLLMLLMPVGVSQTPYHPFLACCLFLVPGVALINFLDDMLDNYLLMGMARMGNAVVQIAAMSFGIVLAVSVCNVTTFLTDLSMRPYYNYLLYMLMTGIASIGFAMNFNVPRRTLPYIALLGNVAMMTRMFVAFELELGLVLGSLAGSILCALCAVQLVRFTKTPIHVLSIPSVIPMVPGILMYRGIFGFVHLESDIEDFLRAFNNVSTAGLIVLCISLGVAIPNIFARRWIAKSRKLHLIHLIKERKKRGKFVDFSDLD